MVNVCCDAESLSSLFPSAGARFRKTEGREWGKEPSEGDEAPALFAALATTNGLLFSNLIQITFLPAYLFMDLVKQAELG